MEYVIVVLLCLSEGNCGWHKTATQFETAQECIDHGKLMDFGPNVARAGCAKVSEASDLPVYQAETK